MSYIDYKGNDSFVSRADLISSSISLFEDNNPTKYCKIEEDITTIIPYLAEFTIENVFHDEFINSILGIKFVTADYYFKDYNLFNEYNFFNTLFLLAFPTPGNECDFLQSRALKIMKNLVECPIKWYAEQFVQMEVIQKVSEVLISKSDAVINSAIKLLISIAPIDISYTQDILAFIKVKTLIGIYEKFQDYNSIKNSIIKLVYYLSRCDVNSDISDFINFISILIYHNTTSNCFDNLFVGTIITIFQISYNLMKNPKVVSLFHNFPPFIQLLNFSLKFNYDGDKKNDNYIIWLPAIKAIDYMHYYSNDLIEGLDYELFLTFLNNEVEEISELVAESLINILACQNSTVFFVDKYDIINKLVYIRSIETSYSVKKNAIEAISNAILCSPTYLLPSFIKSGCISELIGSFFIDNNEVLCKVIESLDILLSQRVLDEQDNDITEIEFINNFDESCLIEIQNNEDEKVKLIFERLISNHPDYFQ